MARLPSRAAPRRRGRGPGVGHWLPYGSGLVVLALALMSPLDAIGDRYLLSAHMVQHILLSDVAPALLVLGLRAPILPLGLPRAGLRLLAPGGRAGRVIALATSPLVALPLWAAATWLWAIPAVFDYSAAHSARARARARDALLHGPRDVVADHRSAALGAPRARTARRLAYLGFTRLASAARLPAAGLHDEHRLPALRRRAARLRPQRDQRPAARGRRHVLPRVPDLRHRDGRGVPELPEPRRAARSARRPHRPAHAPEAARPAGALPAATTGNPTGTLCRTAASAQRGRRSLGGRGDRCTPRAQHRPAAVRAVGCRA